MPGEIVGNVVCAATVESSAQKKKVVRKISNLRIVTAGNFSLIVTSIYRFTALYFRHTDLS